MSENRVLATNGLIQIETCNEADEELLTHLKSAVLGTPGRTRYRLTRIENKLAHMKEIYFMILRMRSQLVGSIGFNKRSIFYGEKEYQSWYIRYFYIFAPFRSREQKKEKFRDPSKGTSMIRDAVLPYMKEPALLIPEEYDPSIKSLVYGYIESYNFRSLNMSGQSDAETVRKFTTLVFSRFRLKTVVEVRRLEENEIGDFKSRLRDFYRDYTFYTDENMFFNGNYFVYERDGEILAGVQVHPETWKIIDMPGRTNKLLIRIFPKLPYVRNIFNPDEFRFLAMEGIYYTEGNENLLQPLIESVCKHFKTHFALVWADVDSELMRVLNEHIDFGTIGRSFDRLGVDIRVTFNNFTEEEKMEFFQKPSYISAFDSV